MHVFLVRAARTSESNRLELSARGRAQAEHLGRWIAERAHAKAPTLCTGGIWTSADPAAAQTGKSIAEALGCRATERAELSLSADVRSVMRSLSEHATRTSAETGGSHPVVLVCAATAVVELIGALLSPEQASATLLRAGEGLELEVRLAQPIGTARVVGRGYLSETATPVVGTAASQQQQQPARVAA